MHERAVSGWAWPEATAYRRSTAPPVAIVAVYTDFESQASYIPGIVASRVVAREAPNVAQVFFEYDVPGPNEQYTVIKTVTRDGEEWQVQWKLVRARYARRLQGTLRVVPRGAGSLLVDANLVDPGMLAVGFGSPATVATGLRKTVEALTARTERMATTDPTRLAALVEAVNAAVRAKETPAR